MEQSLQGATPQRDWSLDKTPLNMLYYPCSLQRRKGAKNVTFDPKTLPWYGKVKDLRKIARSRDLSYEEKKKLFLASTDINHSGSDEEILQSILLFNRYGKEYWRDAQPNEKDIVFPLYLSEIKKDAYLSALKRNDLGDIDHEFTLSLSEKYCFPIFKEDNCQEHYDSIQDYLPGESYTAGHEIELYDDDLEDHIDFIILDISFEDSEGDPDEGFSSEIVIHDVKLVETIFIRYDTNKRNDELLSKREKKAFLAEILKEKKPSPQKIFKPEDNTPLNDEMIQIISDTVTSYLDTNLANILTATLKELAFTTEGSLTPAAHTLITEILLQMLSKERLNEMVEYLTEEALKTKIQSNN